MEYTNIDRPGEKTAFSLVVKKETVTAGEPAGLNFYDSRQVERTARLMVKLPPENSDLPEDETKTNTAGKTDINTQESCNNRLDEMNTAGTLKNDQLLFQGMVRDDDNNAIENAVVMLFACYIGGEEKPSGHCYTNSEGKYIISIPEPPDLAAIAGYKIMAGISVSNETAPSPTQYEPVYEKEKPELSKAYTGFHSFIRHLYYNPGKKLY